MKVIWSSDMDENGLKYEFILPTGKIELYYEEAMILLTFLIKSGIETVEDK
jgi:hypothetical protein